MSEKAGTRKQIENMVSQMVKAGNSEDYSRKVAIRQAKKAERKER